MEFLKGTEYIQENRNYENNKNSFHNDEDLMSFAYFGFSRKPRIISLLQCSIFFFFLHVLH